MMLFGHDVESGYLSEYDADIVRRYYVARARLWIIKAMTAAALVSILCAIAGVVK